MANFGTNMELQTHYLGFPISLLLAVAFLLASFALHRHAKNSRAVRLLGSMRLARILLAVGAVFLAVEGTWSIPLHRSIFFLAYELVLLLSLSLTLLDGIGKKGISCHILNHAGFLIIVLASLFGSPDVTRTKITAPRGQGVNVAYTSDNQPVTLPFDITLEEFEVDLYPGTDAPRQFTSKLLVDGEKKAVSVNHPLSYGGYTLFQDGFDPVDGSYSVLQVVRDPWLPVVFLGMLLLAVGSVMLLFGKWKARLVIPATLVLTALFTVLTISKINFGTLMPALRSWLFIPHIFIYMVAYSLMALALVMLLLPVKNRKELSANLVRSSSALLVIGMLIGAVWARRAWGDCWAWDPKENWAAVTWFVSQIHLHLTDKRGWKAVTILLLAFLALQVTWYGVNYLPSALESLHTYNL